MKLNYDCIRDILLTTEEENDGSLSSEGVKLLFEDYELLKKYDDNTVQYHANQLYEAGYLEAVTTKMDGANQQVRLIKDLTWKGHELLNNIRDRSTFEKTKKYIAEKVGSASLSIFVNAASAFIKNSLNL